MKYRRISRCIAMCCLYDSTVNLILMGLLAFSATVGFVAFIIEEKEIVESSIFILIFLPFVLFFCGYCIVQDFALLKATEKGRDPESAVKLCKSWIALTKFSFIVRFVALVLIIMIELSFYYDHDFLSSLFQSSFGLFLGISHVVILVLFPGPFSLLMYLDSFWPSWSEFSALCRLKIIGCIVFIVLLRRCSLYFIVKFNKNLKIIPSIQSTEDSKNISITITPTEVTNNSTLNVSTNTSEAFNILTFSPVIENQRMVNQNNHLPSYEDATDLNPPSYDSLCHEKYEKIHPYAEKFHLHGQSVDILT